MEKTTKKVTKPKSEFERLKEKTLGAMDHDLKDVQAAIGLLITLEVSDAEKIIDEAIHSGSYSQAMEVILRNSDSLPKLMLLAAEFGINYYRLEQHLERRQMVKTILDRFELKRKKEDV
jgi:hypothetical protein